ncbi:MAG: tetratricopeptide repeat protein [Bacteroidales bacterium]|nr:tetratricopeptide repeat protein [Bacteroidales bacterium]
MNRLVVMCLAMALLLAACNNDPKPPKQAAPEPTETTKDVIELLTDSIAMDENRADLYLQRAKAYVEREQVGAAMVDVTKAIEVNPKNIDAFLMLADIYYMLGDQANITATLNRALEIDPYDSRPMVKLAEINMLQQNYDLALGYIDNAMKVSTFNPRAYFVRGMIFMAKQDTTSALKNFLTAREQDNDFFDPNYEVCKIYGAQNNPLSEQFLRSTVTRFPDQPLARYELALYLQDHDQPEEALIHYDTLLTMQPGNSRLLFNKGYVYFVYLGDNQKALDYFNQSLDSDPNYLDALYNKGHVLEQMGDYVQAKTIYSQVLKQQPNYELAVKAVNRIANQMEE